MEDEILTGDDLTQGVGNDYEGGSSAVSDLSLDELNSVLGKNFKDKETALKSIKDTYSYVGKKAAERPTSSPKQEIDTSKFITAERYEEDMFFAGNQELAPYREVIRSMRKEGQSIGEVVNSDAFKPLYEKAKAYDESQKSRSVLETNSRLGSVSDNIGEARTKLAEGNTSAAKESAVKAVLDLIK